MKPPPNAKFSPSPLLSEENRKRLLAAQEKINLLLEEAEEHNPQVIWKRVKDAEDAHRRNPSADSFDKVKSVISTVDPRLDLNCLNAYYRVREAAHRAAWQIWFETVWPIRAEIFKKAIALLEEEADAQMAREEAWQPALTSFVAWAKYDGAHFSTTTNAAKMLRQRADELKKEFEKSRDVRFTGSNSPPLAMSHLPTF